MKEEQLLLTEGDRYYVYLLGRPNGSVFYVGKGCKNRIDEHEYEARKGCECDKCRVIRNIWANDGQVIKRIVYRTDSNHDALCYEGQLIRAFRQQLSNKQSGRKLKHIHRPLIDHFPPVLKVPRTRRAKVDRRQALMDRYRRADMAIRGLERRLNRARLMRDYDLQDRIVDEIEAYELWIRPPIQLRLEGF